MLLSYKYRLYPNASQRKALDRILELHRQLYNQALYERREAWRRQRVSVSFIDQAKQLTAIRKFDEEVAWLNQTSVRWTLRRLDKAFGAFFRRVKEGGKPGYPRFKGRGWFKSVCYTYGNGAKLRGDRLYLQHVGCIRMFQHRSLPESSKIKTAIVKRDRIGNWHVVLQVELADPQVERKDNQAVGIDMGLEHFAALSTGELIANPRWFRASEHKLAVLQRRRSRCKRGSRQYKELTRQIRKLHNHIANQRRDFHHKLSTRLVQTYGFIVVEDLNIAGLARSHVSKSVGDAGWSYFLNMLSYKAERAGGQCVRVNPNGTSQICSRCGCRVQKSLAVRVHNCPHCGLTLNRDVNAAINILTKARTEPPRKVILANGGVVGSR